MLQVNDDGVTMLALMCDLRELSLRECAVSDAGLESLAQGAKNLEVLDLSRCQVKKLQTRGCTRHRWEHHYLSHAALCNELEAADMRDI